jgi:hypothetical protein
LDLLDRRHRSTIEAGSFVVSAGPPLARLWRIRPTLEDEWDQRLAAIVPAELAAELENLTLEEFRELLEDFADAQAAREALAEIETGARPVPAEQVWAELGLES